MKRPVFFALPTLFAVTVGAAFAAHAPEISEKMTGQPLPSFLTQTLEGQSISEKTLQNKKCLVNFFASWCPPCRTEIAHLRQLHEKYKGKVAFYAVLIDPVVSPETVKDAKAMFASNPLPYPIMLMNQSMKDSFKFEGIPTLYLVTDQGKFSTTLYGPQAKNKIDTYLQKLSK